MRLWMINSNLLCRHHLLGEHREAHTFLGSIKKHKSIKGYITKGFVEIHNIKKRHDILAKELLRRGYKHKSPMEDFSFWQEGKVDIIKSIEDLYYRCVECRNNINKYYSSIFAIIDPV